jgi:hypothetical protein
MTGEKTINGYGWRVYGLGVMAIAVLSLIWGEFASGQSVPKAFPGRVALAYVVAAFMFAAGAAIVASRRTAVWAAAALAAYYTLIVVIVMNGRVVLANYTVFGAYSGVAEQLAIAMGALIIYAAGAKIDAGLAARLTRIAQIVFGVCAVLFGGAHFVYMDLTAPLVPAWLPPSQVFWGHATGVGHVAAGLAILSGVRARLAAILLTAMYASFLPLVFLPVLLADPTNHFRWGEAAATLVLTGVAWVMADSLARLTK